MKCPACGFDSPDTVDWCDFCKEPFRKRRAPPAAEPAPPAPAGAQPAGFEQLAAAAAAERIPATPPWLRFAAWAFLGLWVVWGMVLLGFYLGKKKVAEESRLLEQPSQGAEVPPAGTLTSGSP